MKQNMKSSHWEDMWLLAVAKSTFKYISSFVDFTTKKPAYLVFRLHFALKLDE